MTKRKLNEAEKTANRKSIKRLEKGIPNDEMQLKVARKGYELIQLKREYDDMSRPFKRKAEDEQIGKDIMLLLGELDNKKNIIKNLKNQNKEGVEEIKKNGWYKHI